MKCATEDCILPVVILLVTESLTSTSLFSDLQRLAGIVPAKTFVTRQERLEALVNSGYLTVQQAHQIHVPVLRGEIDLDALEGAAYMLEAGRMTAENFARFRDAEMQSFAKASVTVTAASNQALGE